MTGFVYAPAGDPSSAAPQGHPPHRGDTLACDGVSLAAIAAAVGTPCYVYSSGTLDQRVRSLQAALGTTPAAIHYALKANSTLAVIRHLRALGVRGDANSIGEIEVALRAGFIPDELVFTGVGKSRDELERAIGLGVGVINAESPGELARIDEVA
ncbi:MAG: diaminopimelate decarboxylase, partial [Acidobacteria bacterium]|nr:diaminopimelate decarboxylase [Acidobacteriota bacterium]